MRHRKTGRRLGRSSSHRKAMLRNLASSLVLTERDDLHYEDLFEADGKTPVNPPAQKGRVVTTVEKAKEVRGLVEKCITIARRSLQHERLAEQYATSAERQTEEWKSWRNGDQWQKWNAAMAPAVAARRRVFSMLRDKEAVAIIFDELAPRFEDRPGGYTRILKLAHPRLGDAGKQAILEFVGIHDRVTTEAQKPAFAADVDDDAPAETESGEEEVAVAEEPVAEEPVAEEPAAEAAAEEKKD